MEIDWQKVNNVIGEACNQLKSNNLHKVQEGLQCLRSVLETMDKPVDRKLLSDKLVQLHFLDSIKTILNNIHIQNMPHPNLEDISRKIINLLQNLTNINAQVCQLIIEKEIHLMILTELKETYNSCLRNKLNLFTQVSLNLKICSCLGVFHNILRIYPDSKSALRSVDTEEFLVKLKQSNDDDVVKLFVNMVLCLILDNNTVTQVLKVPRGDISFLLDKMLDKSLADAGISSDKHASRERFSIPFSFGADEVFQCLSFLAMNRDNALEMIKQGVVSKSELYLEFAAAQPKSDSKLEPNSMNNAIKWALNLLRRLKSSVPETFVLLTFTETLKQLKDHPNDDIAQFAFDLCT